MRTILAHIIFLLSLPLFGQQNFVPNPSFEDTIECNFSTLFQCSDWSSSVGSVDYFKAPSNCWSTVPTPSTSRGFQFPYSGLAYIGLSAYCSPGSCGSNFREVIQVKLSDTLQSDKKYCVSFHASLSNDSQFATDDIGVFFTEAQSVQLPNEMSIRNVEGVYLDDTLNWSAISGSYVATGQESYLNLGNSYFNSTTNYYEFNSASSTLTAYYFIDDVSVIELPEIDAGSNQTIFPYETATLSGHCEGCWNGLQYAWYPSVGLSDSTILNPTANPEITTTYYLTLIDTTGNVPCMSDVIDSVTVFVEPGPNLIVFPNPSTQNENVNYYVGKVEGSSISILLHDVKGKLIYEKENIISDSEYALDLRLAAGVYTLSLFSDSDLIETKKLVIEE